MSEQIWCRRYTLKAASYQSPAFRAPITAPFIVTVAADSPLKRCFENEAFSCEDVNLPYRPEPPLGMFKEEFLQSFGVLLTIAEIPQKADANTAKADNLKPSAESSKTAKTEPSAEDNLDLVPGIEPVLLGMLHENGYVTVDDVIMAGEDKLDEIESVGPATAKKILAACHAYLNGSQPG